MENSNSVEAMISNIVTVVFRIHFYYVKDKDLEADLKQEGFLKAYELLASGNYDPSKNLRTFIYTGVRNAMSNYMYHTRKHTCEDLDYINSSLWQKTELVTSDAYWQGKIYYVDEDNVTNIRLSLDLVRKICDKYIVFGDYFNVVLQELQQNGLCSNIEVPSISSLDLTINHSIKDMIMGQILWNILN